MNTGENHLQKRREHWLSECPSEGIKPSAKLNVVTTEENKLKKLSFGHQRWPKKSV
jgi:hypothetical protein